MDYSLKINKEQKTFEIIENKRDIVIATFYGYDRAFDYLKRITENE